MPRHSTAQHSTAQHSTAQHSTAQHSTASLLNNKKGVGSLFYYNGINPLRGKLSPRSEFSFLFTITRKIAFVLFLHTSVYAQSNDIIFKNKNFTKEKTFQKEKILSKKLFVLKKDFFEEEMFIKKIALRDKELHYDIYRNVSILGFANYESFDKLFEFYKKELCMGVGVSLTLSRKTTKKEK